MGIPTGRKLPWRITCATWALAGSILCGAGSSPGRAQGIAARPPALGMAVPLPDPGMASGAADPPPVPAVARPLPPPPSPDPLQAAPRPKRPRGLGSGFATTDGRLPNQRTGSRHEHVVRDICIGC